MNNLFQTKIKNIKNLKDDIDKICSDDFNVENNEILSENIQSVNNVNYKLSISNSQIEKQLIFNIVYLNKKKNEYHYSINHSSINFYFHKYFFNYPI